VSETLHCVQQSFVFSRANGLVIHICNAINLQMLVQLVMWNSPSISHTSYLILLTTNCFLCSKKIRGGGGDSSLLQRRVKIPTLWMRPSSMTELLIFWKSSYSASTSLTLTGKQHPKAHNRHCNEKPTTQILKLPYISKTPPKMCEV
jgi:hypothetical protein